MNFRSTYDVTPTLQDESVKQYFWHVMLRPRLARMLAAVLAMAVTAIIMPPPYQSWIIGFLTGMLLFLVITWAKTYYHVIAQARAGLRMMEHPNVEITIDATHIEYVSSTGTRRHPWSKIESLKETNDFIILMNGKLPLLSLPKACFSTEALDFLKHHAVRPPSGQP